MNTDSPITKPSQDRFGYAPLAERVAPILVLDAKSPSVIAGVESRWGSGKTSFLNLTKGALEKLKEDVLIFEYRPWLYSTVDSLVLGFCVQIAAQLQGNPGKKYQTASKALIGLSGVFSRLTSLPGEYGLTAAAGAAGSQLLAGAATAMQDLTTIDLSNARQKVQHALDNAGRPAVIFIDDVDRLEPSEIRLLFQFLKAVADFRRVAYFLAYDPKPVEKALSFGGELSGREYLKKFIQMPIRLPRISNLLLQRFFREAVEELDKKLSSPLSANEKSAIIGCTQLAVLLHSLKTPRDVVRLLNSFRVRLDDCRGEVNLDQLLLFVLLDLVSPEAVELVRMHPELFLLPMTRHPEFQILETDNAMSQLLAEEKDKATQRERLFSELPKDERPIAERLISHLFNRDKHRDGDYDVRRAQSAHGMIKLLYGGASSLSFSAKDAISFLHGVRRTQIIDEIVSAGVLLPWIYFLSSITNTTDVKNPIGIAKAIISAVKNEPTDTFESVHRVSAEYLLELLERISSQKARLKFIDAIAGQRQNLYVAEHFLAKLAAHAGLWKDGQSFSVENRKPQHESDLVPPEVILDAEAKWLRNVRAAAANSLCTSTRTLVQFFIDGVSSTTMITMKCGRTFSTFGEANDPVILLRHFPIGVSLDGLDKIIADPSATKKALLRYNVDKDFRQAATRVMDQLGTRLQQQAKMAQADGVLDDSASNLNV